MYPITSVVPKAPDHDVPEQQGYKINDKVSLTKSTPMVEI
jgi:hypothetical protein